MEDASKRRRRLRYVARAWSGKCPQCGEGELFERYAKLRADCSRCGLVYRRESGAVTGSMYLSAAVTEIFAALLIAVIFIATDWGVATSLAVSIPIFLAFTYWFLPRSIALWTAVEYIVDESHDEPWVRRS